MEVFIPIFLIIVIYLIICFLIVKNIATAVIMSLISIFVGLLFLFGEKNKLKYNFSKRIAVFILCCILTALPIGLSISQSIEKKECSFCKNGTELTKNSWYGKELSTTATCTKNGKATIQCKYCERTVEIEVDMLGHDFKITKDESNCLKNGNTYYTCSRKNCGETKTEYSKASPSKHNWVVTYSKETVAYTYTDYKCSICNETKTEKTTVSMGYIIKNTEEEFYYATAAAIRIVKGQLKYPSSARFIKESQMEVHYNYSTSNYFIEGAVSAPNAFGVYTDFYFIVKTKIRVTGDKFTWYDYDCILEE